MNAVSMPCSALLISDTEDDCTVGDSNATEFTHSTVWYCRNSQYLVHRTYLAHFERGLFSLTDAGPTPETKYMRPFLPENVRNYLENLRVVLVGSKEVRTRCLHFPITSDEFKLLVSFLARAKTHGKPSQERLVFAIRNAANAMVGRVGFDAARMVKECNLKNFTFTEERFGLFTAKCGEETQKTSPVTIASASYDMSYPGRRVVALSDHSLYIANEQEVRMVQIVDKKVMRMRLSGVTAMQTLPTNEVMMASKNGHIVCASTTDGQPKAAEVMNVATPVLRMKVSRGGIQSFALMGSDDQTMFFGTRSGGAVNRVSFHEKVVDYDLNNDDCYVAQASKLLYFLAGQESMTWDLNEMYEQTRVETGPITSVCMDAMTMSIGVCTSTRCFLVDARMPRLIGAAEFRVPGTILSFHPSPFMDIGVVLHDRGFATVDVRKPEAPMSKFIFSNEHEVNPLGTWIRGTRLFAMTSGNKFLVTCPYLRKPVLEAYELPMNGGQVVSLSADLNVAVVQQTQNLSVFGGVGTSISFPEFV